MTIQKAQKVKVFFKGNLDKEWNKYNSWNVYKEAMLKGALTVLWAMVIMSLLPVCRAIRILGRRRRIQGEES